MTIRNFDALLAPRSIVLVGATPREGSVGGMIAKNLLDGCFQGPINFVNPKHAEIMGKPCHPDIASLPSVANLAVIATPPSTLPGLIGDLARAGTRAAVVITGGLDEALKQRMLNAGRPSLLRIMGPNCIGLMLPRLGLNASFSHRPALKGDLAFLSQSGALVTAVVDWASDRGIGFSHVVSLGDMNDVDFGDMLDYLAGDTASRAILLYMEALTHAPKFMSAARRAARAKPVIVIKSGRHTAAARAAASHTGRLAGRDAAYDAAFRRAGLLRVTDLSELFEAAEMLARAPRRTGDRLLIVTNGGGAGVLAADHLADQGGVLAELSSNTIEQLNPSMPAAWSRANPLDIIGDAGPDRYECAVTAALADENCDAVLAINCPTALASSSDVATRVVDAYRRSGSRKVLITNWLGDGAAEPARRHFNANRIPTFDTPGAAVRGFMQLVCHTRVQEALMRTPPAIPHELAPNVAAAEAIIRTSAGRGGTMLSEADAKSLLATYGIPIARSIIAENADAVEKAAAELLNEHAAVVLKILSPQITHKTDVGGVVLDLGSAADAAAAAALMRARVASLRPEAHIEGFTVSPMIRRPRSHELIVGMSVDSTFGPLIMFGAGGTSVEVVADTALALPPLDSALARELISRTRVAKLLAGYRDHKPADIDAIAEALVRLSALICGHPEIREIDINPLLADERGVIALDARVRIADEALEPRVLLSVKPYPEKWTRRIHLDLTGELVIRPIMPTDEPLYERFFEHVTQEDRRLRFFAAHSDLSHKFLARLTQIDYAREMAFVALSASTGELLGVSRFAADPDYENGEYAVLVRSDLKGAGLGWALMKMLIEYATESGLSVLHGSVLAENTSMLAMCRNLGFSVRPDPDDLTVRNVELKLRAN